MLCLLSAHAVYAHMQLILPPAINSKFDPQTVEGDMQAALRLQGGAKKCRRADADIRTAEITL